MYHNVGCVCSVFVEENEKKSVCNTNVFGGFMFGSLVRFYFLLCIIISTHFAAECVYFACDDEFARFSLVSEKLLDHDATGYQERVDFGTL